MGKNLFFTGGLMKSGTTLLQKMLNMHPDICCLKEQDLNKLLKLFAKENDLIKPFVDEFELKNYFPLMVKKILESKCEKKLMGLKDNKFLLDNIDEIPQVFQGSKMIFIVRNPIDNLLSWWDHNDRLAKLGLTKLEENKYDFFISRSHLWSRVNEKILSSYNNHRHDILVLRYEDIITNKELSLEKAFLFLKVKTSKNILENIIEKTSFSYMKRNAQDSDFFKEGRNDFGKSSDLDQKLKIEIEKITNKVSKSWNYL